MMHFPHRVRSKLQKAHQPLPGMHPAAAAEPAGRGRVAGADGGSGDGSMFYVPWRRAACAGGLQPAVQFFAARAGRPACLLRYARMRMHMRAAPRSGSGAPAPGRPTCGAGQQQQQRCDQDTHPGFWVCVCDSLRAGRRGAAWMVLRMPGYCRTQPNPCWPAEGVAVNKPAMQRQRCPRALCSSWRRNRRGQQAATHQGD